MKKLKDFFYDKNDIVISLIVLILAGLIITWRIDIIMNYPATLAEETDTTVTTQEEISEEDSSSDDKADKDEVGELPSDDSEEAKVPEKEPAKEETVEPEVPATPVWTNNKLTEAVTVTIPVGSEQGAVQALVDAGLFDSYNHFVKVCKNNGCKASDIKGVTFTFPKGSTRGKIAKMVTK